MLALASPASLKGVLSPRRGGGAARRRAAPRPGLAARRAAGRRRRRGNGRRARTRRSAASGTRRGSRDPLGRPVTARWLAAAGRHGGRRVGPGGRAAAAGRRRSATRSATTSARARRAAPRGAGGASRAALLVGVGGHGDGRRRRRRCATVVGRRFATRPRARALRRAQPAARRARGGARLRPAEGRGPARPSSELEAPARGARGARAVPRPARRGRGRRPRCGASRRSAASCVEGAELVLDTIGFDERAARADLVVTGEGTVDATTLEGKAPGRRRPALRGGLASGASSSAASCATACRAQALSGGPSRPAEDLDPAGRGASPCALVERCASSSIFPRTPSSFVGADGGRAPRRAPRASSARRRPRRRARAARRSTRAPSAPPRRSAQPTVAPKLPSATRTSIASPAVDLRRRRGRRRRHGARSRTRARATASGLSAPSRARSVSSARRRRSSASSGARRSRSWVAARRCADRSADAPSAAVQRVALSARAARAARRGRARRAAPRPSASRRATSAARSHSGVSCSWPTAETTGTAHAGDRPDDALVGERQQVLEAAAAAGEHDHVGAARAEVADRGRDRRSRARALHVRLRDEHVRGREALHDVRQHVALRRRVVAGDEPDQPREAGQRALAALVEQPLRRELLLQPLERGEVRAEAEALDRERLEPQLAALLVELRPAEDVDALAFGEAELERVELPARHLDRQARAVLGVLEREEHRRPALLAAELGHLALDPERRQLVQVAGDPAVERRGRCRPCARRPPSPRPSPGRC